MIGKYRIKTIRATAGSGRYRRIIRKMLARGWEVQSEHRNAWNSVVNITFRQQRWGKK